MSTVCENECIYTMFVRHFFLGIFRLFCLLGLLLTLILHLMNHLKKRCLFLKQFILFSPLAQLTPNFSRFMPQLTGGCLGFLLGDDSSELIQISLLRPLVRWKANSMFVRRFFLGIFRLFCLLRLPLTLILHLMNHLKKRCLFLKQFILFPPLAQLTPNFSRFMPQLTGGCLGFLLGDDSSELIRISLLRPLVRWKANSMFVRHFFLGIFRLFCLLGLLLTLILHLMNHLKKRCLFLKQFILFSPLAQLTPNFSRFMPQLTGGCLGFLLGDDSSELIRISLLRPLVRWKANS
eukprot:GHVN01086377.1.p1 GENE.GHVN01086377.1~~GHVN01086377.1.p1  ORF type:complete len:292 (-),score=19.23 GHVN01086377.1:83-958(-)